MEEPTREVAEREPGTDNSIERDEAGSEARVEEPAKDVGETRVKLSKGTGREEAKSTAGGQTAGPAREVGEPGEAPSESEGAG